MMGAGTAVAFSEITKTHKREKAWEENTISQKKDKPEMSRRKCDVTNHSFCNLSRHNM